MQQLPAGHTCSCSCSVHHTRNTPGLAVCSWGSYKGCTQHLRAHRTCTGGLSNIRSIDVTELLQPAKVSTKHYQVNQISFTIIFYTLLQNIRDLIILVNLVMRHIFTKLILKAKKVLTQWLCIYKYVKYMCIIIFMLTNKSTSTFQIEIIAPIDW